MMENVMPLTPPAMQVEGLTPSRNTRGKYTGACWVKHPHSTMSPARSVVEFSTLITLKSVEFSWRSTQMRFGCQRSSISAPIGSLWLSMYSPV